MEIDCCSYTKAHLVALAVATFYVRTALSNLRQLFLQTNPDITRSYPPPCTIYPWYTIHLTVHCMLYRIWEFVDCVGQSDNFNSFQGSLMNKAPKCDMILKPNAVISHP